MPQRLAAGSLLGVIVLVPGAIFGSSMFRGGSPDSSAYVLAIWAVVGSVVLGSMFAPAIALACKLQSVRVRDVALVSGAIVASHVLFVVWTWVTNSGWGSASYPIMGALTYLHLALRGDD